MKLEFSGLLSVMLVCGCNGILHIHEPSYAVVDSGVDAAMDASTHSDMNVLDDDDAGGIEKSLLPATPFAHAAWPMPNPKLGDLNNPAVYRIGGGVVIDEVTGLAWQQAVAEESMTWAEAGEYCDALMIGGTGGYRLPSRIEMLSLFDPTRPSPTLDLEAFPNTPADVFWTVSPFITEKSSAWTVRFGFSPNVVQRNDILDHLRVRCVRPVKAGASGQVGTRYERTADHITDSGTKLVWQRDGDSAQRTWQDAATYCRGLHTDDLVWRVPTVKELETLVDEAESKPSIDPMFPVTFEEYYWSSSPAMSFRESAWTVSFALGFDGLSSVNSLHPVRCVH